MFDPTVFDNLKVAFENQLYDLDNLSGTIRITGRIDRLEMSTMSREFSLQFALTDQDTVKAEIRLAASLKNLAAEILEVPGETPGCTLLLRFLLPVKDIAKECAMIEDLLQRIWKPDLPPTQTISFVYGGKLEQYMNTVELQFNRQINEEQMGDIPDLIEYMLLTLTELSETFGKDAP